MTERVTKEGVTTKSGRVVQLTREGREFQMDVKEKNYKRLAQKLQKDASEVLKSEHTDFKDQTSRQSTLQEIGKWMHTYIQFVQTEEQLQVLLPDDEAKLHRVSHSKLLAEVNRLKTDLEALQQDLQGRNSDERNPEVQETDAVSVSTNKSCSSSVVRSQMQLMRLKSEQVKAEAAAKLSALKRKRELELKKQELEKQKQELEWQEEEFEHQTLMSIQEAQEIARMRMEQELEGISVPQLSEQVPVAIQTTVKQNAANMTNSPTCLNGSVGTETGRGAAGPDGGGATGPAEGGATRPAEGGATGPAEGGAAGPDRGGATGPDGGGEAEPEGGDRTGSDGGHAARQNLSHQDVTTRTHQAGISSVDVPWLRADQVRLNLLPALEPEKFKGNVEQFALWMKSFETYIESRTSSPVERLHYLSHYTAGEAHDATQGFLHLRTNEAYIKAKQKLMERYGNSFITAMVYRQRLRQWPMIRPGDGKALRHLADFLEGCQAASEEVSGLKALGDANENSLLLKKLPKYIVDRWKRVVDSSVYGPGEGQPSRYPAFSEFVAFLSKEARVACGPVSIQEAYDTEKSQQPYKQPGNSKVRAFATGTEATSQSASYCRVCKGHHTVKDCSDFRTMNLSRRHEAVKSCGLCRGCLKPGHIWRSCKKRDRCDKCSRWHPTLLHDDSLMRTREETNTRTTEAATTLQVTTNDNLEHGQGCSHAMIVPVRLQQTDHKENQVLVYALLDPQSDACFISDSVRDQIHADGEEVHLELSTMAGKALMTCSTLKNLMVRSLNDDTPINLPATYAARYQLSVP